MIEITCPSCGARYRVPDESIGPAGRNVTCSNCAHKWRAHRPEPSEPAGAGAGGATHAGAKAGPSAEAAAETAAEIPAGESTGGADAQRSDREEQMDAIRRMLEELRSSAEDIPPPEPEKEPPIHAVPGSSPRRRDADEAADEEDEIDPLKARIRSLSRRDNPIEAARKMSDYDAEKLRKRHERRVKRLQRLKARRKGSGAFATGMTLVGAVAAVMAALYLLHPQIAARSPEMAPALQEYVVAVDRMRLQLDEATGGLRTWIDERLGRFIGDEEPGADQQQG